MNCIEKLREIFPFCVLEGANEQDSERARGNKRPNILALAYGPWERICIWNGYSSVCLLLLPFHSIRFFGVRSKIHICSYAMTIVLYGCRLFVALLIHSYYRRGERRRQRRRNYCRQRQICEIYEWVMENFCSGVRYVCVWAHNFFSLLLFKPLAFHCDQ